MELKGTIRSDEQLHGNIEKLYELRGYSAYEIAVINGFKGTEEEWVESLKSVYVGGGDMPDGCVVQIDPEGEAITLDDAMSDVSEGVVKNKAIKAYVDAKAAALLDLVYPVGSIYMSVNAADPSALFGGTWERLRDRFLLAAGDSYAAGATGGEATHTLTVAEMPNHDHPLNIMSQETGASSAGFSPHGTNRGGGTYAATGVGGSKPHNNMPPYLAVYMWKRTA